MKHFFDGASIMASFDDIKSDTLADLDEGTGALFEGERFALSIVSILEFLCKLFLHFQIALIGSQRVAVIGFVLVLFRLLFLGDGTGTKLMGLRYFFTCSYSLSLTSLS